VGDFMRLVLIIYIFFLNTWVQAEDSDRKPSAILQIVCWDQFSSQDLVYYPWGNYKDKNATVILLNVTSGIPTKPFAYYGKSPLEFFVNESLSIEDSSKENQKRKLKKVAEVSLDISQGITVNLFLLLIDQKNGKELKVFPLPLDQATLPYGSFKCYSQFKKNLYIAYGPQKKVLEPGKSVNFNNHDLNTIKSPIINVFTKDENLYSEQITDFINVNRNSRAILFFTSFKQLPSLKKYYFKKTPMELILGNGSTPTIQMGGDDLDKNSSF
jgi:hypothetical protein